MEYKSSAVEEENTWKGNGRQISRYKGDLTPCLVRVVRSRNHTPRSQ